MPWTTETKGTTASGSGGAYSGLLGGSSPYSNDPYTQSFVSLSNTGDYRSRVLGPLQVTGEFGSTQGFKNLLNAAGLAGLSANYYGSLLSGDRQSLLEAEAPEVNTLVSQYDTNLQNVGRFSPRGGGTTSTLTQTPYNLSAAVTNLLAGVRPQAAQGLLQAGGLLGSLGSSELSAGQQGLQDIVNFILKKKQLNQQDYSAGDALLSGVVSGFLTALSAGGSGGGAPK